MAVARVTCLPLQVHRRAKAARGRARTPKVRLFAGPNDNGVAGSVDDRKVATQKIFGIFVRLEPSVEHPKCLDWFPLLMRKEQLLLLSAQRTTHNR